jgi:serine/threonine-protein kinase
MAFLGNFRAGRLLEQLTASDAPPGKETSRAVEGLCALGAGAIEPILAALPNASRTVQAALVDALASIADTKTIPLLLDALADGGPRIAPGIVSALKRASAVPAALLIQALRRPELPKPPLLEVIKAHRDRIPPRELLNSAASLEGNDKTALFRLIGETATVSLVPELINRLQGKDTLARLHLISILERFDTAEVRHAMQAQLGDDSKVIRTAALGALAKMNGPVDIERVCRMLCDGEIEVQNRAVDVLIRARDPETVRHLIPVLKDENEYARRSAVEVLNEVGDAGSIKYLLSAMKDSDWWVRSRAGDALGKIGGPRVIQAVLQLARDDDPELRRTAIEILNQTKDEQAIAQLIDATRDKDWWVSERAVDALGAIGSKRALPRLLEMIENCEDRQLPVVIRAVAAIGDVQGIDHLLPLLKRPDRAVRLEVIQSLGHLSDERLAEHVRLQLQALVATSEPTIVRAIDGALAELNARFTSNTGQQATAQDRSPSMTGRFKSPTDVSPRTLLMSEADVQQALRRVEPEPVATGRLDIATLKPGEILEGRYKYIQRIGKGAFGTVLLMEDTVVDEQLILKFLNPGVADDPEVMKRFVHELRYSRKITHHNVIRIYDFLEIRGNYAISMEYFPSHTLGSEVVDDKPLELKRAIRFGMDICTGMAVAHEVGIVHRDLKPANVLINDAGELKIVDFGVAAAHREGDTQLTKTGFVIGSPKYMAPEQILGRTVDQRADIYAVGVILYELLTGVPPYTKGDHMSVMYQHVQGKATPPAELNPALPPGLGDVVSKAMAVDKNKRYQSMAELKAALEPFA